ncbi:MAG: flagella basal body P-ring formation protein FlgA [Armatimonadetes bacterium]|nr:flagella basal body P-ring formation protein FlgA [Armatimonadota bacterium]
MTAAFLSVLIVVSTPPAVWRVDGEGYFRLSRDGRAVYAKEINPAVVNGKLGTSDGATFLPAIQFSSSVDSLEVDLQGNLSIRGQSGTIGRLVLAVFPDGSPVQKSGNYYTSSERPRVVNPGDDTFGVIRGGSSVKVVETPKQSENTVVPQPQPKTQLEPAQPKTPTQEPTKAKPSTTSSATKQPLADRQVVSGSVRVVLKAKTEITGGTITLKEMATFAGDPKLIQELESVDFGLIPPIGVERKLDLARVRARIQACRIDIHKVEIEMPQTVVVTQKHTEVDATEIVSAAVMAAEQSHGKYGTLSTETPVTSMQLPLGEYKLVADQVTASGSGFKVYVSAYVDGKLVQRKLVSLLRTGVPQALKFGQTVKVVLISGGVAIETSGRVTRVGKTSEEIEVTLLSGKKFLGTQTDDGTVEVKV